jgi:hypothetical protein
VTAAGHGVDRADAAGGLVEAVALPGTRTLSAGVQAAGRGPSLGATTPLGSHAEQLGHVEPGISGALVPRRLWYAATGRDGVGTRAPAR